MIEYTLYCGLLTRDKIPIAQDLALESLLVMAQTLIAFTITIGIGQDSETNNEPTLILTYIGRSSDYSYIRDVASKYAEVFEQSSVLLTTSACNTESITASDQYSDMRYDAA